MIITPPKYDYGIEEVHRVVDGDTFDLTVDWEVDHGFFLREHKSWTTRFRLYGIDVVESRSPLGPAATAFTTGWLRDRLGTGMLRCATYKPDDFGRWLADIYSVDGYLRVALAEAGFMKPGSKWNL